ncbi:MAG: hypothetical protein WCF79_17355 [Rhodomicrobium sp.]
MQGDAKLGSYAVAQIDTPKPHNAIAGEIGVLLDPGCKFALFDPAQACRPAASRPVDKPIQTFLIVAMNPVAQRLPVHSTKPRRLLAAKAIEHLAVARMRDACLALVDCFAAARKSAALISVRVIETPTISTPRINTDAIDSQNEAEGNLPP